MSESQWRIYDYYLSPEAIEDLKSGQVRSVIFRKVERREVQSLRTREDVSSDSEQSIERSKSWLFDWKSLFELSEESSSPEKMVLYGAFFEDSDNIEGLVCIAYASYEGYEIEEDDIVITLKYLESAPCNRGAEKNYHISPFYFALACKISADNGGKGEIEFFPKNQALCDYYMEEFGAVPVPVLENTSQIRLMITEDQAKCLLSKFRFLNNN